MELSTNMNLEYLMDLSKPPNFMETTHFLG